MTIPSVTAVASLAALGVTYAIAHRRIHYWKQWGADLFEQFHDSILDRLDVDLDMTELTSQ